jgi:PAS domain S-box-containing protein
LFAVVFPIRPLPSLHCEEGFVSSPSAEEQLTRRDALVNLSREGIFVRNLHGVILYWNQGARHIYGWTAEEAAGQISHQLLQTRFPRPLPDIEAIVLSDGYWEGELIHHKKGGARVVVSSRWAVQLGASGEPVAILEINSDVSARRRWEIMFRGLLESSPDAVAIVGQDGRILQANGQAEKLFGYSREELSGQLMETLVPTGLRAAHSKQRKNNKADACFRPVGACPDLFARRKDGSEVPVDIRSSSVKTDDELLVFSFIRDATERRTAQKALGQAAQDLESRVAERTEDLRHNESRLRALVESIDEIVFELDIQGRCLSVWALNEALLPRSKDEMIGVKISDLLDEDGRRIFLQALQRVATNKVAADIEYSQSLPAGKKFFLSRITPIRPFSSKVQTFWMAVRDNTERKILQQRMEQGQKMEAIGRLAGGIAHDFNNLLAIMMGYAELIQESASQGRAIEKEPAEIIKAAESAASLTRQLLAFSRQQILKPRPLDLNAVVREIDGLVRRLVGESITVKIRTDPELKLTKADSNQMEQVILNLAANAKDAMADGGELRIETANLELKEPYISHPDVPPGRYVVLTVADNGAGMDAETQAKIFEPFFTTKPQGKGTGLGLCTVYGIVHQSGGYIFLNTEIGHGATFKVLLPQLNEPAVETENAPELPAAPDDGETILLVEDAEPLRRLVSDTLIRRGYKVLEACNGIAALALVSQCSERIDLLITDMAMPEMGGRQLSTRLRETRPGIRVLYITGGYANQALENDDSRRGAPLLEKPFTKTALLHKVHEVLHGV